MTARFLIGNSLEVLKKLPDDSVDLVLTSPPFLALRSYLPSDHPDKAKEIGGEATPGEFVDALLDIVEECARLLTNTGSMAFELGDSYSGSGGSGGDYNAGGMREGQARWMGTGRSAKESSAKMPWKGERAGWPLAKSLCLIPELFRVSLVYGINPLTGRTTKRWRARNVVRWVRPNPPVGALGDKFRPATSEMVIVCKSDKRYFDLDAVRNDLARDYSQEQPTKPNREADRNGGGRKNTVRELVANPAGAPPLDWWSIPPSGYSGSHYAVYPPELCVRPIKAMCPQYVCRHCNTPWAPSEFGSVPACEHQSSEDARKGVVLDPFAGSGTTLMVAEGHGRDSIGIDIDSRNADLARERVGMFLEVEG